MGPPPLALRRRQRGEHLARPRAPRSLATPESLNPHMKLYSLIAIAFGCGLGSAVIAQGRLADYARAAQLRERFSNKVFRASVKPEWTGGRFWYRNDLAGGRREFVLVDAAVPSKRPAFDHARLAAALSSLLHKSFDAERLPVERIAFTPDGAGMRLQIDAETYLCDLKTYALRPDPLPLGRATPLSPETAPHASYRTGEEIYVTFLNRSTEDVQLFWLDGEGLRHPYGVLKPGQQNRQRTFAGHAWLVTKHDGSPLVAFVAVHPALAVIDGVKPEKPH